MNAADSVVIIQDGAQQAHTLDDVMMDAEVNDTAAHKIKPMRTVVLDDGKKPDRVLPANWPAGATVQADGSVILTLEYPVRFKLRDGSGVIRDGDSYEELHLHRLKGKHKQLLTTTESGMDFERKAIACSTGLDAGKIGLLYGEMDQADIKACMAVVSFFTTFGRSTGPAS